MRDKEEILSAIRREKIISIVRLKEQALVRPVLESLVAGGIKILEITTNTPGFDTEIERARQKFPKVFIGAGTVTTAALAQQAITAGAQFLVTPNTSKEVVQLAQRYNVPVLMGALSPTEISEALAYGADSIKLFPSNSLGIAHYKALKGPYDQVDFFAVGGIDLQNCKDWFEAGITGLGIGGALVPGNIRNTKEAMAEVQQLAQEFLKLRN